MAKPSTEKQQDMLKHISEVYATYDNLSTIYRNRNLQIYDSYSTFTQQRKADRQTTFKVNKAHEVVNKILPRVMAKNPKWIVSVRTDEFTPEEKSLQPEQRVESMVSKQQMADGIQDYITYLFDRYNLREPLRLWAKNMLIYGNSFAKIKYKYETMFGTVESDEEETDEEGNPMLDEAGEPKKSKVKRKEEKVIGEYPTIESKSWTDIYIDPRYVLLEDMPAIIEVTRGVRLSELERNKNYFNLDKVKEFPEPGDFNKDPKAYKEALFRIAGIQQNNVTSAVDKKSLIVKEYYGWYSYQDEQEKIYKITEINDCMVIGCEEISYIPLEDIKCFEDTEVFYSVGFVEPILSLQDEMNFKKNSASEYINQSLNRSWIWSPNSGINPKDLVSKPGNIMVTSKDAQTALANVVELPFRALPADYFNEQNDLERQIQSATFTVDTSNQRNEQALTNTATGIRVKFFESNSVIDEIRKHYEEGMQRLAYKLLMCTYDNMEDNIIIKKIGTDEFLEMNKEAFKDAILRYDIKVEVNSSSVDSIEDRREEAIAKYNLGLQAMQAGVQVDATELFKNVMGTFENSDMNKILKQTNPDMGQIMGQQPPGGVPLENTQVPPTGDAASLTMDVAGGNNLLAQQM